VHNATTGHRTGEKTPVPLASPFSRPLLQNRNTSMRDSDTRRDIVDSIKRSLASAKEGTKRLKVKTLLARFGFKRRTEENTTQITTALRDGGVFVVPSIMKLGEDWELNFEDWVYLSLVDNTVATKSPRKGAVVPPANWASDGWFDRLTSLKLRSEKEVETKFIIPLLARLGFDDDDRYDDMPVEAAHGSKHTILLVDSACFNASLDGLKNQVLLTVEAKREDRLRKKVELQKAKNQAKSYALWTGCYYCMVTDGRVIEALRIARSHIEDDETIFSCAREDLKRRFSELYGYISKQALTAVYLQRISTAIELK